MLTPEQKQLAEHLLDEAGACRRSPAHTPEPSRSGQDAVEFIIAQHKASRALGKNCEARNYSLAVICELKNKEYYGYLTYRVIS